MAKQVIDWEWEEAFDKFGFGDGDGWIISEIGGTWIDE